jgi:hypothetical protein
MGFKSVADLNKERRVDHGGPDFHPKKNAKDSSFFGNADLSKPNMAVWSKFKPGMKVIVRCAGQDFYFFYDEEAIVEEVNPRSLGIKVRFVTPRRFEGGYEQKHFGFNPSDLEIVEDEVQGTIEQKISYKIIGKTANLTITLGELNHERFLEIEARNQEQRDDGPPNFSGEELVEIAQFLLGEEMTEWLEATCARR